MKGTFAAVLFAAGVALCASTGVAQAQVTRTWVSGVGDDTGPCSRTAPCKTFAGAISKTAAGGEIDALDAGGFGTVNITKSITIDGGGQIGSIMAESGTTGVTVNAGALDVVILRNLRINGISSSISPGVSGINFLAGLGLLLENDDISDFPQYGIFFEPGAASTLEIRNSVIENAAWGGIMSSTSSGLNHITVLNSAIRGSTNGPGVSIGQNTSLQMTGGAVSSNVRFGVLVSGTNASGVLDGVTVSNNYGGGIHATNGGAIGLTNCAVTLNVGTGLVYDGGGQILSWGDNHIAGNKTSGAETDGTATHALPPG
ncbi:MAG TPA: right-handed parallel beta-helix repeat-containing protein [Candidatus Elarobacter sp.]|jgi:hypothetical protein|nr:right-handed parallel beta-helix repeat-containing protein [Candidatus Elarobacter sp.]